MVPSIDAVYRRKGDRGARDIYENFRSVGSGGIKGWSIGCHCAVEISTSI
jgi:hypothetical protein